MRPATSQYGTSGNFHVYVQDQYGNSIQLIQGGQCIGLPPAGNYNIVTNINPPTNYGTSSQIAGFAKLQVDADGGMPPQQVPMASGTVTITTSRPNAVIGTFQGIATDGARTPVQGTFQATCITNEGCE